MAAVKKTTEETVAVPKKGILPAMTGSKKPVGSALKAAEEAAKKAAAAKLVGKATPAAAAPEKKAPAAAEKKAPVPPAPRKPLADYPTCQVNSVDKIPSAVMDRLVGEQTNKVQFIRAQIIAQMLTDTEIMDAAEKKGYGRVNIFGTQRAVIREVTGLTLKALFRDADGKLSHERPTKSKAPKKAAVPTSAPIKKAAVKKAVPSK